MIAGIIAGITWAVETIILGKKTLTLHKVGPCPSLNGKAIAELRSIRSQSRLTHSRSLNCKDVLNVKIMPEWSFVSLPLRGA